MRGEDASVLLTSRMLVLGRRTLASSLGDAEVTFFRDHVAGQTAMAIARGDLEERSPLLTRVHSSCVTSECLMACDCDCAEQLTRAWEEIAAVGRGVVFYLMQEGRGAGLSAKARDRMIVQASGHRLTTFDAYAEMGLPADLRRYDVIGPMARALGIRGPIDLLTNNPEKAAGVAEGLASEKIDLRDVRSLEGSSSPFNRDYLLAKRQSGHFLERGISMPGRLPPEPIEIETPMRAAEHSHLISTASYLLPVSLSLAAQSEEPVDWFRMRVVYDLRTARESVLLSNPAADSRSGTSLTLTLVDRLPCSAAVRRRMLRDRLLALREAGEGPVVVHFDESNPNEDLDAGGCGDGRARLGEEILAARWLGRGDPEMPSEGASGRRSGGVSDVGA